MSDCVLESEAGKAHRKRMIETARELEIKLRPVETQYCEFHRNNHLIEFGAEAEGVVDSRYGMAPVDVPVSDKPDTYKPRNYCVICSAYHGSGEKCAGQREQPEDWGKKEAFL